MLNIALSTMRTRWVTFVGTFVALSLGVGLIATMGLALASTLHAPYRGPERFATAPVVVRGADTLRVPTSKGDRVRKLSQPRAVPAALATSLATLGPTVADRTFAVHITGGPAGAVGHPWSTAAYTPYRLTAGHAPTAPGDIVISGDWAAPGHTVAVRTGGRSLTRTVVGSVRPTGFEDAVFFTDAEAATLSTRIDNLVVRASADAVRSAVSGAGGVQVLTGDDRRRADPDPDRDSEALVAVNALLGTAGGITGFVSVFVVASTFAFSVAQRRREFGLLRTAGATPRQIRRMVFAEATVIGVLASAAGCVLGAYGAPRLATVLVDGDVAPAWFAIGDSRWPYYAASSTGLLVTLAGVWAASRRAGKVAPIEALRDAAVDARTMTPGRWAAGGALLATGAGLLLWRLFADPTDALHRKTYTTQPMLLITAVAFLAPVLVRPLTRWLAWLPAQLPGAVGMLVRENAAAGVRRTAAIAAPVLVTVALAGSLLGATATINAAKASELRERTTADFVLTAGDAGFDAQTVARVRAVPGSDAAALATTGVYRLEDGVALIHDEAQAVDPAALAQVAALPLVSGKVSDLTDDGIVVNEEWEQHTVGQTVQVWLGDGTRRPLRIVAVMRQGTGNNGVYVTPRNGAGAAVERIDVRLRPGAGADAVGAALSSAVRPAGGRVLTKEQWVADSHPHTSRQTRIGFWLVLGIALLYTAIALANTLVMATSDRVRDLAVLRLAGATTPQVLRLVAAEALMVVVVGAVLGTIVAGVNLLGIEAALAVLSVSSPLVVPWAAVGAVTGACAVVAVFSAVLPAGLALRTRPVEPAGMRE
ncbi:ABC transporter permease [Streptomyces sp. H39-S7]|uniref:ABC transporter permease n=1 Tax=Streptomyces sp. H39-S7 TaxID=3004357 RepID=UPI0022AF7B39|nr:ABC transporter permease [Streptomyces sp. H39-S7]MCZ4123389.1 ABC transporter permease [Streptomyces sp. H39-S7]